MEQLASPDTIYLSDTSARLVDGYFALDDLGEFPVKGLDAPARVHQLTGIGALRTRFDVSRARGLTRFVGRDADMTTLEAAYAQSSAGNGQVVGVVAPAGTGKSRLCFEFLERCRGRGIPVIEGHALSHGKNIPFLPMLEIFRDFYGIEPQDDPRTVREKIAGRLLLLDESFRDALPVIFENFGVADPNRPGPPMDAEARQRLVFSVLRRVVRGEDEPFVAFLDDLHWLDPTSELFLAQWVDALQGARSLLLVNFRPEFSAEWTQRSWYRQIALAPLGPDAIQDLLDDLLGSDASVAGLATRIHQRTGGNPFFTEEVVQGLIESGKLEGTRGAYRLIEPVGRLEIPSSVTSLLASRIDRLAEREKHVLQAAAVLGKTFAEPLLEAIADVPQAELRASLDALKRGEFLYEQSLYPVAEYAFKHPLTQEVALGAQLSERRKALHAAAARALQESFAARLDESAALLAHHWEEAGQPREAARWQRRAAQWVRGRDPVQSIRHWQRVRALAAGLDDDEEAKRFALEACSSIANMGGWRLGLPAEEMTAIGEQARGLAQHFGDRNALVGSVVAEAARKGIGGDTRAYYDAAIETCILALAHLMAKGFEEAARTASDALALVRDHETAREFEVEALSVRAQALVALGDAAAAVAVAREAVALAAAQPNFSYGADACCSLVSALLAHEGVAARTEIEAAFAQAFAWVDESGAEAMRPRVLEARAALTATLGDDEASARDLAEALRLYRAMGAEGHAARLAGSPA
jgi:hypothetical protein